jgi:hypothetical protein
VRLDHLPAVVVAQEAQRCAEPLGPDVPGGHGASLFFNCFSMLSRFFRICTNSSSCGSLEQRQLWQVLSKIAKSKITIKPVSSLIDFIGCPCFSQVQKAASRGTPGLATASS